MVQRWCFQGCIVIGKCEMPSTDISQHTGTRHTMTFVLINMQIVFPSTCGRARTINALQTCDTSVLQSTVHAELIGCPLAIMQSSLPLWSFEHSDHMTLCACLDALMPRAVPHAHVIDYLIIHVMHACSVTQRNNSLFFSSCVTEFRMRV